MSKKQTTLDFQNGFFVYLYSLRYFAECRHQQMLLACLAACSLLQRQFLTAKHSQLQEDIFKHVVNIITSTSNFGVQIRRINKVKIVEVTSKPELQQLLHFCLGNKETSLKQEIPGKGNYYWQRETLHCYLQLLKFVITESGIMIMFLNLPDIVAEGIFRRSLSWCMCLKHWSEILKVCHTLSLMDDLHHS